MQGEGSATDLRDLSVFTPWGHHHRKPSKGRFTTSGASGAVQAALPYNITGYCGSRRTSRWVTLNHVPEQTSRYKGLTLWIWEPFKHPVNILFSNHSWAPWVLSGESSSTLREVSHLWELKDLSCCPAPSPLPVTPKEGQALPSSDWPGRNALFHLPTHGPYSSICWDFTPGQKSRGILCRQMVWDHHERTLSEGTDKSLLQRTKCYPSIGVSMLSCFSHVQLFVTPWPAACQAPLSMGFPRQESWTGWLCHLPGDLLDPGIKPTSALAGGLFTAELPGKPQNVCIKYSLNIGFYFLPQAMGITIITPLLLNYSTIYQMLSCVLHTSPNLFF